MRGRQGVAAVFAGALIVLALLAVFAIELSENQAKSRRSLETQAHERAQLVAGLTEAVFQQRANLSPDQLGQFGHSTVPRSVLDRFRAGSDYAALLDGSGRILASSSGFNGQARHAVLTGFALRLVRGGDPWALGNIFPYRRGSVLNFAERLSTPQGQRILVTGIPLAALTSLVEDELRRVPGAQAQHELMLDGAGVVIGSTVANRPAGYRFHTSAQLHILTHGSGVVTTNGAARYYDQVPLGNTSWRLVLSIPSAEFFASVTGARHWLPWIIFVAFGIVAVAALGLVLRAMQSGDRIREANARLRATNAELGSARGHLQEANQALEESNGALGRSNAELERQARELVRSNAELDQFASIASHDLQEPLRKVRTFTERISETESANLSERGADYLRRANASAERMQTLIEDLLRYSRVSTQGRPFSAVDLGAVLADVMDDLSEQVARDGARVTAGPLPTISADASQMRQLLQNLVSNALKFRRAGVVPEVRIAGELQDGWLTLTIADNGIGFDPQYARRIFRVFERLHGRGAYPGTGIGLALCRKIAERHGGTVTAHGVPDEGATFVVTLQTQRTEAVSDGSGGEPDDEGPARRTEPYVAA